MAVLGLLLGVLLVANVLSEWDRYLIGFLTSYALPQCATVCQTNRVQPLCSASPCAQASNSSACEACAACLVQGDIGHYNMGDATCMSGLEYGSATVTFSIVYAAFSLVAGRVVDVVGSRAVLVVAIVVWSLATASQALAHSTAALFAARAVLGIAESVTNPACYTLIASFVPPPRRGPPVHSSRSGCTLGLPSPPSASSWMPPWGGASSLPLLEALGFWSAQLAGW